MHQISGMDTTIETPIVKSRRSSIFKPVVLEPEEIELYSHTDYPKDYEERLLGERKQWNNTLHNLKRERVALKIELAKENNVSINNDLLNNNLEIFDHTLHHNYLQSIQNLHIKLECLLDKRETGRIVKHNDKDSILKFYINK